MGSFLQAVTIAPSFSRSDVPWQLWVFSTDHPLFCPGHVVDGCVLCPSCSVCTSFWTVRVLLQTLLVTLLARLVFCLLLSHVSRAVPTSNLSPSSSDILSSPFSTRFNSVPSKNTLFFFCFSASSSLLQAFLACRKRVGPLIVFSSRRLDIFHQWQIHMSIVYAPLFTPSLIIVPSRAFRMCGFCSWCTTMFPDRTTVLF